MQPSDKGATRPSYSCGRSHGFLQARGFPSALWPYMLLTASKWITSQSNQLYLPCVASEVDRGCGCHQKSQGSTRHGALLKPPYPTYEILGSWRGVLWACLRETCLNHIPAPRLLWGCKGNIPGGLFHVGKKNVCLLCTLFLQPKWLQPIHQVFCSLHPALHGATRPPTFPDWALLWHRPCLSRPLCCTEHKLVEANLCSFTWVEPEESSGAAKVLPSQRGIPFKVVHKNRIQSFWHVNAIQNVRVCGAKIENGGKSVQKRAGHPPPLMEEGSGNKGNRRRNAIWSKALTLVGKLDALFK